jgi:hypothetical protein
MRARFFLLVLLVLVALALPGNCWRRRVPRSDTTKVVAAPPPPPRFLSGAGGRPITFTMDSLPAEIMVAVKARYPEFVPHDTKTYPESARGGYSPSPDNGLSIARGNFTGGGLTYAVAGIQGQSQMVVGVVPDPNANNGWSARSISSTGTPPFSPWVTVSRRRRGHPNGRWDAVAIRILDPGGAYDDVYWWNPGDKRFYIGSGAR